MALHDELDQLLACGKVSADDWDALYEVLAIKRPSVLERRKTLNTEIRHNYGHTLVNFVFRDEYDPDYMAILRGTAKEMKVPLKEHHTAAEIEDKLIIEVIDSMKAQIIKEKGQKAWDEIELDTLDMAADGGLDPSVVQQVKKYIGEGGIVAAIIGGKLAGFKLYQLANKLFFVVNKKLALGVGVAVAGPVIGKVLQAFLGWAGWVIAGVMMAYDIGDTNWKKTIPTVFMVAMYRRKYELV